LIAPAINAITELPSQTHRGSLLIMTDNFPRIKNHLPLVTYPDLNSNPLPSSPGQSSLHKKALAVRAKIRYLDVK
jgi:hypothetical protein